MGEQYLQRAVQIQIQIKAQIQIEYKCKYNTNPSTTTNRIHITDTNIENGVSEQYLHRAVQM